MNKLVADQADGLRRLLAPTQARVVAVAGMGRGAGGTTAAMDLAVALVGQGRNVLLLDEHCPAEGSAGATRALSARKRSCQCATSARSAASPPSVRSKASRSSGASVPSTYSPAAALRSSGV